MKLPPELDYDQNPVHPVQSFYKKDGRLTHVCYFNKFGDFHRNDGPAIIHFDENNNITDISWFFDGWYLSLNDWCKKTNNCRLLMTMISL